MFYPYQLTEDICKHGNLPTWAPVKPYTELAEIFKANCRPSSTIFLKGSVSFFNSVLALGKIEHKFITMLLYLPFVLNYLLVAKLLNG